jgi:hypothetical protein
MNFEVGQVIPSHDPRPGWEALVVVHVLPARTPLYQVPVFGWPE